MSTSPTLRVAWGQKIVGRKSEALKTTEVPALVLEMERSAVPLPFGTCGQGEKLKLQEAVHDKDIEAIEILRVEGGVRAVLAPSMAMLSHWMLLIL